jgi:hypothetical protein
VWSGNVTQPYTYRGQTVRSTGVPNTLSTIQWLQAQVASGAISSSLESFVVMGCSAGSVGTQMWADQLLAAFPAKETAVVRNKAV